MTEALKTEIEGLIGASLRGEKWDVVYFSVIPSAARDPLTGRIIKISRQIYLRFLAHNRQNKYTIKLDRLCIKYL
jgi:hypothetical protein